MKNIIPNETTAQALMHEKHTLREWMVLFREHPELWNEFEKMCPPKPIE